MSEKNTASNICFIGGDKRQIYAAQEISLVSDVNIIVSGETFLDCFGHSNARVKYEENPLKALRASSIAVLPIPASNVEKSASFADVVSEMRRNDGAVIAGKFSPYMLDLMDEENVRYADLMNDESFNIKNAYVTAEGAIFLAMNTLDTMLRNSKCFILGFGRIGKALSQLLTSIGCKPVVYARKEDARSLAREMGCFATETTDLSGADVIFNTVPQRIISNDTLLELPSGRILIELASAPGGFDPDIAIGASHSVIDGRGLPGKYAPASAGKIVSESILSYIRTIQNAR